MNEATQLQIFKTGLCDNCLSLMGKFHAFMLWLIFLECSLVDAKGQIVSQTLKMSGCLETGNLKVDSEPTCAITANSTKSIINAQADIFYSHQAFISTCSTYQYIKYIPYINCRGQIHKAL